MRIGAAILGLSLAVCAPSCQSPQKCRSLQAVIASAAASGASQADEVDWNGPPGSLVRISAPEEPFLPLTTPRPEPELAPRIISAPAVPPAHPSDGLARAFFTAPVFSPYFSRTAGTGPHTPMEMESQLRDRGFTQISGLELRGETYLCEATGPRRERVRLVIDARSGEISGMEVIGFDGKRY